MKYLFRFLRGLLPHLTLILSLLMLTLFVIDIWNPAMAFLNNSLTKILLGVFSFFTLILSILFILGDEDRRL